MANILFLTLQTEVARSICEQFVLAGHQVEVAYSLEAAKELLKGMLVDVLLLDSLFCGGGEGIDFILKAKSASPQLLIILSVCAEDQAIVYELLSVGIITSWIKDAFQNKDLLSMVENILHRCRPATGAEFLLGSERQGLAERRKSPRKEIGASVRWRCLGDSPLAPLSWTISQTRNISLRGLMLETDRKLDVHQQITLEICLSSQEEPIQADGQVRWVGRDAPQNQQQCGIQLMEPEGRDMTRLLDYLSG